MSRYFEGESVSEEQKEQSLKMICSSRVFDENKRKLILQTELPNNRRLPGRSQVGNRWVIIV